MPNQPPSNQDIDFTVMPSIPNAPRPEPRAEAPKSIPPSVPPGVMPPKSPGPKKFKFSPEMRKWVAASGAVVLILLLGILIYYLVTNARKNEEPVKQTKLPRVWLNQHFGSESCTDESRCSDESDPDSDGLINYNEFKEGTNPNKADSDEDGLADGDEINIYKTEPGLKYTDRREIAVIKDYNDARDVAENYDPITPGVKMTDVRLRQIENDTKTFGLHEPTITTLAALREKTANPNVKTVSVFIENDKFSPESVVVSKGDTVVWLNKDAVNHQVVYEANSSFGGFQSPKLEQNQTFSFTAEVSGKFEYKDQLNPQIKGTLEVK